MRRPTLGDTTLRGKKGLPLFAVMMASFLSAIFSGLWIIRGLLRSSFGRFVIFTDLFRTFGGRKMASGVLSHKSHNTMRPERPFLGTAPAKEPKMRCFLTLPVGAEVHPWNLKS